MNQPIRRRPQENLRRIEPDANTAQASDNNYPDHWKTNATEQADDIPTGDIRRYQRLKSGAMPAPTVLDPASGYPHSWAPKSKR